MRFVQSIQHNTSSAPLLVGSVRNGVSFYHLLLDSIFPMWVASKLLKGFETCQLRSFAEVMPTLHIANMTLALVGDAKWVTNHRHATPFNEIVRALWGQAPIPMSEVRGHFNVASVGWLPSFMLSRLASSEEEVHRVPGKAMALNVFRDEVSRGLGVEDACLFLNRTGEVRALYLNRELRKNDKWAFENVSALCTQRDLATFGCVGNPYPSFRDQIRRVKEARVLVHLEGAALVHMLWQCDNLCSASIVIHPLPGQVRVWHHALAQYFPRIIIDVLAVRHGASVLHAVNGALRRAKLELAGCQKPRNVWLATCDGQSFRELATDHGKMHRLETELACAQSPERIPDT